jgi:hypothetical protein
MQHRSLWIAVALSAAAWSAQAANEGYQERAPRQPGATAAPAERGGVSPHGRTMRQERGMPSSSSSGGAMSSPSPSSSMGSNSGDAGASGIEDRQLRSALDTCADHPREQRADCAHRAFEMRRGEGGGGTGMPGSSR